MYQKAQATNVENYEVRDVIFNQGSNNNKHHEPKRDVKNFGKDEVDEFFAQWDESCKERVCNIEKLKKATNVIVFDEKEDSVSSKGDDEKLNFEYFKSYNSVQVHSDMIRDEVRTRTYYDALNKNRHLLKDKIVLDVGSGTGILSFFAVKCGAKHVYAIENSDIIYTSVQLRDKNKLTDKVTFIKGVAENVELPVDKVDILISEWMGYCLLYENMLDTVLYCRDKWLKKGGLIFPDQAQMFIAGLEDSIYREDAFEFWNNCYGFDFSPLVPFVKEEVILDFVNPNYVVTDSSHLITIDLNTCTKEDLNFAVPFKLTMVKKDYLNAVVVWFDIYFTACHTLVGFSTGPYGMETHWKQVIMYIQDIITAEKNETVRGMFALRRHKKNPRYLDLKLHYEFKGVHCEAKTTQYFNMM